MKRYLIGISAGVYLLILSLCYWIFFKNPPVGLFITLLCAFAFTLIISGLFEYRKYYNRNLFLAITTGILAGMLTLSYLQTSSQAYQNNLILSYLLI